MSFWKSIGDFAIKAGGIALKEGKAATERSQQYKEEMSIKSDENLLRIIQKEHSSSFLKSGAAMKELESRGYSREDIKQRINN
jgi:hypothetical protein